MIKTAQYLPTAILLIQFGAAMPYLLTGNWRMGLYWLFAAGLTAVVTY